MTEHAYKRRLNHIALIIERIVQRGGKTPLSEISDDLMQIFELTKTTAYPYRRIVTKRREMK